MRTLTSCFLVAVVLYVELPVVANQPASKCEVSLGQDESASALTWSSDDSLLYVGTTNGSVFSCDVATARLKFVSSVGDERIVKLVVVEDVLLVFDGHSCMEVALNGAVGESPQESAEAVAVSTSGTFLFTKSKEVVKFSRQGFSTVRRVKSVPDAKQYRITDDGHWLIGFSDSEVFKFDLSNETTTWRQSSSSEEDGLHSAHITDVVFVGKDKFALGVGSEDLGAGVAICDSGNGEVEEFVLAVVGNPLFDVASKCDAIAVAAGESLRVTRLPAQKHINFEKKTGTISSVQFSRDGSCLAVARGGTITIWDLTSAKPETSIRDAVFDWSD